mmetsp:Transcript_25853/g.73894  ORF Transcript_25853/g.73894 Transcript_25853/m.73894 type:complete len:227 (-) Transcript_25853:189-869(-)
MPQHHHGLVLQWAQSLASTISITRLKPSLQLSSAASTSGQNLIASNLSALASLAAAGAAMRTWREAFTFLPASFSGRSPSKPSASKREAGNQVRPKRSSCLKRSLSYNSNTKTSSEETFWSSPRWFQIGFNEFLTESVLNEHEGLSCTFTTQYGSDLPKPGIQSAFRSPLAPTTTTLTGLGVSASSLEEGVRSVSTFPVSAFVESPDGHLVLVGIGVLGLSNSTGM